MFNLIVKGVPWEPNRDKIAVSRMMSYTSEEIQASAHRRLASGMTSCESCPLCSFKRRILPSSRRINNLRIQIGF
jgi:hypothetical protein